MQSFLTWNRQAKEDIAKALRDAVGDKKLAVLFRADPDVWPALCSLSRAILPFTELHSTIIEQRGSVSKWLAIHADLEESCFRIYEKVNDCDAEAGYEKCVARRDSFEAAVGEIDDRALMASINNEPAVDFGTCR